MLDRCSDADRQNISATVYAAVYATQTLLPSTHVWLGKCEVARGSWFQARTLEMDTGDEQMAGYGATLWVGHLSSR